MHVTASYYCYAALIASVIACCRSCIDDHVLNIIRSAYPALPEIRSYKSAHFAVKSRETKVFISLYIGRVLLFRC